MYASRPARRRCTADADGPKAAQLERRRQQDLTFIAWVRVAPLSALLSALDRTSVAWRRVAIERAIRRSTT